MDVLNLLHWSVWLDPRPEALLPFSSQLLFGVFVGLVILGVASKALQGKNADHALWEKFWKKTASLFFWTAFTHFVLYFFMREGVPFLGMRLWILILYVCAAARGAMLFWYALKDIPRLEKEREARMEFEKYLPRKKE